MIKKNIPNLFTLANLFCGCFAVVLSCEGALKWTTYLVGIACVFDFFDGMMARLLKIKSEIGKQLDSLADMVTFGLVPGIILFHLLNVSCNTHIPDLNPIAYLGFSVTLFSAVRLANFNIDTRQTNSFIGLPTPANAIFICSLIYVMEVDPFKEMIANTYVLLTITLICSALLVAQLPLFALKFKSFSWTGNKIRYIFLLLSIILFIILKAIAIPLIIILYVLISLINNLIFKN